jgi:hypothetical protein
LSDGLYDVAFALLNRISLLFSTIRLTGGTFLISGFPVESPSGLIAPFDWSEWNV